MYPYQAQSNRIGELLVLRLFYIRMKLTLLVALRLDTVLRLQNRFLVIVEVRVSFLIVL